MQGLKYHLLVDIKDELDTVEILDHMKGYVKIGDNVRSFSLIKGNIILHAGELRELYTLQKMINYAYSEKTSNEYIENDFGAFSNTGKALLLMENIEKFKVWNLG